MTHYEAARNGMPHICLNGTKFENYSYIVLPYCRNGTLIDLLMTVQDQDKKLSMELCKYMFRQVLDCLHFMHHVNKLAHLDLKPDNIVINDDYTLSLIDFGHTNRVDAELDTVTGTDAYMPPEIRQLKRH